MSDLIKRLNSGEVHHKIYDVRQELAQEAAARIRELEATNAALTHELARLVVDASKMQVRAELAEGVLPAHRPTIILMS